MGLISLTSTLSLPTGIQLWEARGSGERGRREKAGQWVARHCARCSRRWLHVKDSNEEIERKHRPKQGQIYLVFGGVAGPPAGEGSYVPWCPSLNALRSWCSNSLRWSTVSQISGVSSALACP
jgi:hypothetical protein